MNRAELIGKALKALYSALVAFLGSLSAILVGNTGLAEITSGQWVVVSLASLVAFGGVYGLSGWSGPHLNGRGTQPPGGRP